ncbi:MAG: thiol:disulfide interchange protein [Gammaproteobacteria bacterium RBG_16_51_14]|nr:MAG: thiol:disulfide interchange protein [Gammaproteobacteria bacterium RBG_16_51_14]
MIRYTLPLVIFIGLVFLFVFGLHNDPRLVPSPLIDKPVPAFELPLLHKPELTLRSEDLLGQVTLINVWASWCVSCRAEHPLLVDLAGSSDIKIYGLNYKDERDDALMWLEQLGNPYAESIFDQQGRVGIDFGVYGVPETFVVDRNGIIRYKQIGPITEEDLKTKILPLVEQLKAPVT